MDKYTGQITDVLKSRRFISSVVFSVVALVTIFVPQLQGQEDAVVELILPVILTLIGGYTVQDFAEALNKKSA